MKIVRTTENYTVIQKRSGRYGVFTKQRKWLNGGEKVEVLKKEGLLSTPATAEKEEESSESSTRDASSKEGAAAEI